jgi:hypothetical protein
VRVLRRGFCNFWVDDVLDSVVETFAGVFGLFLCDEIVIIHATLGTWFGGRSGGTTGAW